MDFADVIRRRRMVRTYRDEIVPRSVVDGLIDAALRAPSAGHTQGSAFVVLEGADQTRRFWERTSRPDTTIAAGGRLARMRTAPVIIVPLSHKAAYLSRYAEADKAGLGRSDPDAWPVPFWDLDTAFATMALLLAATDAGLGALFFGIFHGEAELLADLGVPLAYRAIGAITVGWPAADDHRSPSLDRGRRARHEVVHYGAWSTPGPRRSRPVGPLTDGPSG